MMNFEQTKIQFTKPTVLRSNMGLSYSFSGQLYSVKQVQVRPNGVDFEHNGKFFRDVDFVKNGMKFV